MKQFIINLTDSDFQEKIYHQKSDDFFLIDFWAPWCNPCKTLTPILNEIAVEFNDKIKIAKLNVEENPIITKTYNIRSIPTLILIQKGEILSTKIGMLSKEQLRNFLKKYINHSTHY